ncbi:hypothetical protein BJ165DRAFT_1506686 [Panaeolus papilionaceus]|nr:hypothetical protein BJ165DRAFT_1506686 [Panaeolus papilionaceus]
MSSILHTSPPVLPLELFIPIIKFLAIGSTEGENSDFDLKNLPSLRRCALVCKYFAELCQTYIFSIVNISLYEPDEGRILRLIEITDAHPHLVSHIHILRLDFWSLMESPISSAELAKCQSFLLGFPNLRRLSITIYKESITLLPEFEILNRHLIDNYVSNPNSNLKALHLEGYNPLPLSKFLPCSNIREVHLNGTKLLFTPESLDTTYPITFFQYEYPASFPLEALLCLPFLESLYLTVASLTHAEGYSNSLQERRSPCFTIRALIVGLSSSEPQGSLHRLVDLFKSRARAIKCEPFSLLETLRVSVSNRNDALAVSGLLGHTPALKDFNFRGAFIKNRPCRLYTLTYSANSKF